MSLPSSNPGWTGPRVETLTALWRSGLSAAQIARTLGGVTRNAVIGKLHRLGLAGRATPRSPRPIRTARAPSRPARARLHPKAPHPFALTVTPAVETDEIAQTCDLVALAAHACRWPIGDPRAAGFGFCGRPASDGSYCEAHRRRAHRPGSEPLERDPILRRLLSGAVQ